MLDCVCAYALWNGMVRMDTWLARDVWMCAAMRVRARAFVFPREWPVRNSSVAYERILALEFACTK